MSHCQCSPASAATATASFAKQFIARYNRAGYDRDGKKLELVPFDMAEIGD